MFLFLKWRSRPKVRTVLPLPEPGAAMTRPGLAPEEPEKPED